MRMPAFRMAVTVTVLIVALTAAEPARARFNPGPGHRFSDVDAAPAVVLNSALGAGETFGGLEAPPTFNPLHGYPEPGYDTTGYMTVASGFGGVIKGTTTEGATVSLYCIDRNTATEAGIGYDPGAWDLSRVPRLGYVLRVLERSFPATDRPTGAAGDNRRAAAVQAAIWFFTDRFVLASGDVRFALTTQIVDAARDEGAAAEPHASLSVTGPVSAAPGAVARPFLVHGSTAEAALRVTHGTLFADPEGEHALAAGSEIRVDTPFWLRAPEPATARIDTAAVAHNPIGRAFLYAPDDPDDPVPADAQRLILALAARVRSTAEHDVAECTAAPGENGSGENGTGENGTGENGSGTNATGGSRSGTCSAATLAQTGITVRPLADTALGFAALGGLIAVTTRRRPRRKFAASTTSE